MTMDLEQHVLTLIARGRLRKPEDGLAPRQAVRHILDGFAASEHKSMTIYFHGGLVPEAAALGLAHHFYEEINDNFDSYPVFVIWKSGPLETLQSAMLEINTSSPLFMQVLKKLTKWAARLMDRDDRPEFAAGESATAPLDELLRLLEAEQLPAADGEATAALNALIAAGMRPLSDADVAELEQALADDADADRALGMIMMAARSRADAAPALEMAAAGPPATASATGHLSTSIVDQLVADGNAPGEGEALEAFAGFTTAKNWFFAGNVLRHVVQRFDDGTDHGFFGTILEEMYRVMYADKVGRFLWDEMKENASAAYDPIAKDAGEEEFPGGTLFLEEIKAFIEEKGPFPLNVFGHSAGSIHIAHFIAAGAALMPDQFSLKNVFYTAPAINYDLFKTKVAANSSCIGDFRVFTMSDAYERADPLVKLAPILYPHSLLYLVSGIFEDKPDCPLIGLARHLQGTEDEEVQACLALFQSAAFDPIVYAVTPEGTPVGEQAHFTSHYGAPGPNFDHDTLNSMAIQIRPAPITELAEFYAEPPADRTMMEPAEAVILGGEFAAEAIVDPLSDSRPELEQIIATLGDNDIIDHAFIDALVSAGRSVARIVALGVDGMPEIDPDARSDAWADAEEMDRLILCHGTGWILGKARRVLITNNHVLPLAAAAQTAQIEFGYERVLHRGTKAKHVMRLRPDQLFLTDPNMTFGGLDYSVVALKRPAPPEFGYLDSIQGVTANAAKDIFVVQHPNGNGKAYVLNHNHKVNLPDRYVTYTSDTLKGSSGAALFNEDGDLVGIHHLGGYVAQVGTHKETTNLGSRIEFVIADIARRLREETDMDEEQVAYWFGERSSVLRAWKRAG